MNAYPKDYLHDAMKNLGGMIDYAVNDCQFQMDDFLSLFIISGVAEAFAQGDPRYTAGMSGEETALTIFWRCGYRRAFPEQAFRVERTQEYWCGWILAYFQWLTCLSFEQICRACHAQDLLNLYPALHEASEQKAAAVLLSRIQQNRRQSQLQRLRSYAGLTQAALAEKSGVTLRSIQMYEQGRKDINRAQVMTLHRLAGVLGCRESDLMEMAPLKPAEPETAARYRM